MDTVEFTDGNFKKQITVIREILEYFYLIRCIVGDNYVKDSIIVGLRRDLNEIETNYKLNAVVVLMKYYNAKDLKQETEATKEYYIKIISEDFQGKLIYLCKQLDYMLWNLENVTDVTYFIEDNGNDLTKHANQISEKLEYIKQLKISNYFEKKSLDICKCGERLELRPEVSELWCENCQKSKQLVGAVFKDDNNQQDIVKPKSMIDGTTRHYIFWTNRIQALEKRNFTEQETQKIEHVIHRDRIDRNTLNCEKMRDILKDPSVQCTHLNQNAALLVKMHGGPPPPVLTFMENQVIKIKFKKAMALYEAVVPGCKNKPYYPYFIYKLYEEHFKNDPEKLQILNYIHLQSEDTVTKNDTIYEKMSELADPEDGIVYRPTVR